MQIFTLFCGAFIKTGAHQAKYKVSNAPYTEL